MIDNIPFPPPDSGLVYSYFKLEARVVEWFDRSITWIRERTIDPIIFIFRALILDPIIESLQIYLQNPAEDFFQFFRDDPTFPQHIFTNPIKKAGKNGRNLMQLQHHLRHIIQLMRQYPNYNPSTRDLYIIEKLFAKNCIVYKNPNTIYKSLVIAFENNYDPRPPKFAFQHFQHYAPPRPLIFPETLRRYDNSVALSALPNLGATCYLNATLRMMASTDYFDSLLTVPLNQPRNEMSRKHLMRIIDVIRSGKRVTHHEMRTLFSKLQESGWRSSSSQQQDPQEFVSSIIFTNLNASSRGLKVSDKIIWSTSEGTRFKVSENDLYEVACALPFTQAKDSKVLTLREEFKTMEDIVQNYFAKESLPDYRAEGALSTPEKIAYLSEAPPTLLIQAKRFMPGMKLKFDIPVFAPDSTEEVPQLKLPLYSPKIGSEEPVPAEICTYNLKSVICHLGESLNSGHYIVLVHEHDKGWVCYDDSRTSVLSINEAKRLINKSGYYFSYELEAPSEPSEVLPKSPPRVENEDCTQVPDNHTAVEDPQP